jgi:hypothetical protein
MPPKTLRVLDCIGPLSIWSGSATAPGNRRPMPVAGGALNSLDEKDQTQDRSA